MEPATSSTRAARSPSTGSTSSRRLLVTIATRGPGRLEEVVEAGPDARAPAHPLDPLRLRAPDGHELALDVVDQPDLPALERGVDLGVDLGVAELAADEVEHVLLGDRAVEVEHDRAGRPDHRHALVAVSCHTHASVVATVPAGRGPRATARRAA